MCPGQESPIHSAFVKVFLPAGVEASWQHYCYLLHPAPATEKTRQDKPGFWRKENESMAQVGFFSLFLGRFGGWLYSTPPMHTWIEWWLSLTWSCPVSVARFTPTRTSLTTSLLQTSGLKFTLARFLFSGRVSTSPPLNEMMFLSV